VSRWVYSFGLLLLLLAGTAAATEWRMDPMASELLFQVYYEGEPAPGNFSRFDTRFQFDPAHPADGKLKVTVKLTSIDMGSAEINDAIQGKEWLDLSKFTEAEFNSAEIIKVGSNRYVAKGTLRLKGVKRAVEVPFTWVPEGKAARMRGELTVDRTAFGVGTGEWASADPISLGVKVRFNVRLLPAA
jgi:polyisoprenoid-binding protein YceI